MIITDIVSRLDNVKQSGKGFSARCPCHDDRHNSLTIGTGKDGKVLLHCHAGCDVRAILQAMNLDVVDLYPSSVCSSTPPNTNYYMYCDGQLRKVILRSSVGKKCWWEHQENGEWHTGRNNMMPGLYANNFVRDADTVYIVEGEKDVDNLTAYGIAAVSLPDGAGSKWCTAYEDTFAGKQIICLPDNDDSGMAYAKMCSHKLSGVAASVSVVALADIFPGMAEKEDISDLLQRYNIDDIIDKINVDAEKQATTMAKRITTNTDKLLDLFVSVSSFEEADANWLVHGWIPSGQITILAGDGGVGKTTLWINILAALSTGNTCILDTPGTKREPMRVAFFSYEDSVAKKLFRRLRETKANLDNIKTFNISGDRDGLLRSFKLGTPAMSEILRKLDVDLCVFDPLQSFLPPDVNMSSRNGLRNCLAPLIAIGEELDMSFLIVCHTNKRSQAYGRNRISDSADLWDIARSVIMVGAADDDQRYCSQEKNNYMNLQETLLFQFDGEQIKVTGTTHKRDKDFQLAAASPAKTAPKREACEHFILLHLADAPEQRLPAQHLEELALSHGFTKSTLRASKESLKSAGAIRFVSTGSAKGHTRTWHIALTAAGARTVADA